MDRRIGVLLGAMMGALVLSPSSSTDADDPDFPGWQRKLFKATVQVVASSCPPTRATDGTYTGARTKRYGTGIFVRRQEGKPGQLVTARHVIWGCENVEVKRLNELGEVYSGVADTFEVSDVKCNKELDLAVLTTATDARLSPLKGWQGAFDDGEFSVFGVPWGGSRFMPHPQTPTSSLTDIDKFMPASARSAILSYGSPSIYQPLITSSGAMSHGMSGGPLVEHQKHNEAPRVVGFSIANIDHTTYTVPFDELSKVTEQCNKNDAISLPSGHPAMSADRIEGTCPLLRLTGDDPRPTYKVRETHGIADSAWRGHVLRLADEPSFIGAAEGFHYITYADPTDEVRIVIPAIGPSTGLRKDLFGSDCHIHYENGPLRVDIGVVPRSVSFLDESEIGSPRREQSREERPGLLYFERAKGDRFEEITGFERSFTYNDYRVIYVVEWRELKTWDALSLEGNRDRQTEQLKTFIRFWSAAYMSSSSQGMNVSAARAAAPTAR